MSHFRIQRKLTEGSSIKLKPNLSNPNRIRSLQSKQSFTRSPKKIQQHELKRIIKNAKIHFKQPSLERINSKDKMEEVELMRLQGMRAFKEKNVSKAVQIFKELHKNGDKSCQLSYYLGSCYLNLGKHQSSIMYLNECLVQNQKFNQNAYLYIAINFKLMNNYKQAIRILDKGTDAFPYFEQGFFYKGKLCLKIGEISLAAEAFSKSLHINPFNQLASLFLGDCFKSMGKIDKALQRYKGVLLKGKKHRALAVARVSIIELQNNNVEQLFKFLIGLSAIGLESPQINYYLGLASQNMGNQQQSIVYFQSCLNKSKDANVASKALKCLIRISVQQANFFDAEHNINRIEKLALSKQYFREWISFVQGVNDLIKRKSQSALEKIRYSLQCSDQKEKNQLITVSESIQFRKNVLPYLAYAFYLNQNPLQSISSYEKVISMSNQKGRMLYSKFIMEGIYLHTQLKYEEAFEKFHSAFSVQNLVQSIFLACITLVQKYKKAQTDKHIILERITDILELGKVSINKSPLFYFYYTLVLLYQGKSCLNVIKQAIKLCQQPVSQYFFIEALALNIEGKLHESLESISRAIQLDPGIQQFYRQRSKYYFLIQDYRSAIEDCKRAEQMVPEDQQLPLLLAFYHYLNDDFKQSFQYLQKASPSSGKLKQFQQALQLRLGKYDKLSQVGQLLIALNENRLISNDLVKPIQVYIADRFQFSEFSVYFYHLLLAIAYTRTLEYQKSLQHLFGCLEEIQFLVDEREEKKTNYEVTPQQIQEMLDEIKYNIIVVSLMKADYEQTKHFITVFSNQTQSEGLRDSFQKIRSLIDDQITSSESKLEIQQDCAKISDNFSSFSIKINNHKLVTKLIMSYPVKLQFTIAPEFDPSYLLNFDIDKIEYKIPPPWLKSKTNQHYFTNDIRNESILLTESQVTERISSNKKHNISIRQRLKLDKGLQQRLKKIIQK